MMAQGTLTAQKIEGTPANRKLRAALPPQQDGSSCNSIAQPNNPNVIEEEEKIGKDGKLVLPPPNCRPFVAFVQPQAAKNCLYLHLQNFTDAEEILLLSAYFNAALDPNNKRDAVNREYCRGNSPRYFL